MGTQSAFFDSTTHDPGGKIRVKLPAHWTATAEFGGPGDCYRYKAGYRWWEGPLVLFAMTNPSTATHRSLDLTVAKCGRTSLLTSIRRFVETLGSRSGLTIESGDCTALPWNRLKFQGRRASSVYPHPEPALVDSRYL